MMGVGMVVYSHRKKVLNGTIEPNPVWRGTSYIHVEPDAEDIVDGDPPPAAASTDKYIWHARVQTVLSQFAVQTYGLYFGGFDYGGQL